MPAVHGGDEPPLGEIDDPLELADIASADANSDSDVIAGRLALPNGAPDWKAFVMMRN
ncbi:MAG TPA: hypothetical protein VFQ90_17495 [Stellaceae bacterium]|nr:hypothetical protein [Stellaceae bacterium]